MKACVSCVPAVIRRTARDAPYFINQHLRKRLMDENTETRNADGPGRKHSFYTFRAKILIYFTMLFAVVIAVVVMMDFFGIPFTNIRGEFQEKETDIFHSLSLVADLKKERLLRWIEERRDDAHVISGSEVIKSGIVNLISEVRQTGSFRTADADMGRHIRRQGSFKALVKHLDLVRDAHEIYKAVNVVDTETRIIIVSTEAAEVGKEALESRYFTENLNPGGISIHAPKNTETSSDFELDITSPIYLSGKVEALLAMHLSADDIIRPMLHTGEGLGETGEALLVDRQGRILTSLKHPLPDGTRPQPFEYRITAKPATLAAHGQEGIIDSDDYRNEPVLAAFRYIPLTSNTGWGMVVKRDKKELFAPVQRRLCSSILIGSSGFIAVIIISILISRSLSRPIRELSEAAEKVALGDLSSKAPVSGADEIGALSATFNNMVDRIKNWHWELEEQVRARTAELDRVNQEMRGEIADRKKAENSLQQYSAELEQASEETRHFAYVVSHDLRAPLVNLKGFSAELKTALKEIDSPVKAALSQMNDRERRTVETALNEDIPEALAFIDSSATRMDHLISTLLKLSRLGRRELIIEAINMNALVQSLLESLAHQISDREARVSVGSLPETLADRTSMEQIMSNILENAVMYLDPERPGEIEISGIHNGDDILFTVRDNGRGIAEEEMHKVFAPFRRAGNNVVEGEGMGMAYVQTLIRRHGGRIWLESEAGKGTSCFFSIPNTAQTETGLT